MTTDLFSRRYLVNTIAVMVIAIVICMAVGLLLAASARDSADEAQVAASTWVAAGSLGCDGELEVPPGVVGDELGTVLTSMFPFGQTELAATSRWEFSLEGELSEMVLFVTEAGSDWCVESFDQVAETDSP